jgi:hypothetical protein
MSFNEAVEGLYNFDVNSTHGSYEILGKNTISFDSIKEFGIEYFEKNYDNYNNHEFIINNIRYYLQYEDKLVRFNILDEKNGNGWSYINRVECEDYLNDIKNEEKKYNLIINSYNNNSYNSDTSINSNNKK